MIWKYLKPKWWGQFFSYRKSHKKKGFSGPTLNRLARNWADLQTK